VSASCATESARVDQSASVYLAGPNTYTGRFYNTQYNVRGTIYIVVHGNSQTIRLNGDNGARSLMRLSR
jgi:hypothetical protein